MTDASSKLAEKATYCRPNDNKRPELVGLPDATTSQICPVDKSKGADEVTNAYPDGWFVRVMFDELLDPNIEALVDTKTGMPCDTTAPDTTCAGTIAASHPVDLKCHSVVDGALTSVSYDGYYSPAGNAVTWPLGPSLVIKPNDPTSIATNTECEVTLNGNITDKDGNPVPMDERGPYKFKVAPITVISLDPSDDPDYQSPIPAEQLYFDNAYLQFNTFVDINSLCPDSDADGSCDNESTFSIKDVDHPNEGPGTCSSKTDAGGGSGKHCSTIADCDTTVQDDVCGRGYCAISGLACNAPTDCPDTGDTCGTSYAYALAPYGLTDTEFGAGPNNPIETEHKYIFSMTAGAKLKDRCGASTTLPAPTADNLMLAHFITDKFDFVKASIATGETASAMKRLQYNWTNVLATGTELDATSTSSPEFTLSPLPKVLTSACTGTSCPTADITTAALLGRAADGSGQIQLRGHYAMNTEYTATIKAGASVHDFYGKTWTNTSDQVVKWKTAPSILMTGLSVRYKGQLFGAANNGTVTLPDPTTQTEIRLGFNASMDPTTIQASYFMVETLGDGPTAPAVAVAPPSGCGDFATNPAGLVGACSLRIRGLFKAGTYKVTLKAGSTFKDIFGVSYMPAADQSITFTVKDAPAPVQCL